MRTFSLRTASRKRPKAALGLPIVAAILALSSGCKSPFDVTVEWQGAFPADPLPTAHPMPTTFPLGLVSFPLDEYLNKTEQEEISPQRSTSARVAHATLTIADPKDATFDFLESIDIELSAPNLPVRQIAHLDTVPRGAATLSLSIDNVELMPYIRSGSISIMPSAVGVLPPANTTISAAVVVTVVPKG